MLDILLNGAPHQVPAGSTLGELVEMLELGSQAVALAVNRSVVPRQRWCETALVAHDNVEVVRAIGGG